VERRYIDGEEVLCKERDYKGKVFVIRGMSEDGLTYQCSLLGQSLESSQQHGFFEFKVDKLERREMAKFYVSTLVGEIDPLYPPLVSLPEAIAIIGEDETLIIWEVNKKGESVLVELGPPMIETMSAPGGDPMSSVSEQWKRKEMMGETVKKIEAHITEFNAETSVAVETCLDRIVGELSDLNIAFQEEIDSWEIK